MAAGSKGIRAGRAYVELFTDEKGLNPGLLKAQARLRAWGAGLAKIGGTALAIAGPAIAAMTKAALTFSEVGDAFAKTAARVGTTTEAISALDFAAQRSGATIEDVEIGLRMLAKTVDHAASGSDAAAVALGRIGLSAGDLKGLKPEEQLGRVADGLAGIQNPGTRAALAMEIFGRSGTKLLPMLADGSKGLKTFEEEARKLGIILDSNAGRSAEALNDALGDVQIAIRGVAINVGAALAPTITKLAIAIRDVLGGFANWVRENKAFVIQSAKTVALVGGIGAAFVGIGTGAMVAASAWKAAAISIGKLTTKMAVATTAAKALSAAMLVVAAFETVDVDEGVRNAHRQVMDSRGGTPRERRKAQKRADSRARRAGENAPGEEELADRKRIEQEIARARLELITDDHQRAVAMAVQERDEAIAGLRERGETQERIDQEHELFQYRLTKIQKDTDARLADQRKKELERTADLEADLARARVAVNAEGLQGEKDLLRVQQEAELAQARRENASRRDLDLIRQRHAFEQQALEVQARRGINSANEEEIAELRLKTMYSGVELEKQLLALQERREVKEAVAAGADVRRVREKFALQRRLLDAGDALSGLRESTGSFNAFALQGQTRTIEKDLTAAAQDTARNTREMSATLKAFVQKWGIFD